MNVFIVAFGTRGDFELFLFLGQALHARGHRVVVGSLPFNERYVRAAGLEWLTLGDGTQEQAIAILRSMTAIPDRGLRVWEYVNKWIKPQVDMSYDRIQASAEAADYFISNLRLCLYRGKEPIPGASVLYDPPENLQRDLFDHDFNQPPGKILNLVAMNKRLMDSQDQWGPKYRFTGFWKPARPTVPEASAELVAFLKAGPAPVVVTLGSMAMFDPDEVAWAISEALQLTGQRGVIVGGWSDVAQAAEWSGSVLCVKEAPYDWLFPQAACVIHHGGVGTLAAVLRAGKISILFPQVRCQEIWGWILGRAGLATGFFDVTNLYPEELADAIHRAAADEQFQRNARAWQQVIAEDMGLSGAVDLIEEHWKAVG